MDLFSFLSFHFMSVTVTVVIGHFVALSRRSHLFSMMSSLHDVLVHDSLQILHINQLKNTRLQSSKIYICGLGISCTHI
jgi:hypothetical protein